MHNRCKAEKSLKDFISQNCEDQGICVNIHPDVREENFIVIKVDDFYNSLNLCDTPPSVDCLIIQQCHENTYQVTLIELKNVERAKAIDNTNLVSKYKTTLTDFISGRFKHIFSHYDFHPYLVLCAGKVEANDLRTFDLDFLLGLPLLKFRGKIVGINGFPPTPTVNPC